MKFVSAVVNYTLMFRGRTVHKEGRLSYGDFVWFLISEEDKKTETRSVKILLMGFFVFFTLSSPKM